MIKKLLIYMLIGAVAPMTLYSCGESTIEELTGDEVDPDDDDDDDKNTPFYIDAKLPAIMVGTRASFDDNLDSSDVAQRAIDIAWESGDSFTLVDEKKKSHLFFYDTKEDAFYSKVTPTGNYTATFKRAAAATQNGDSADHLENMIVLQATGKITDESINFKHTSSFVRLDFKGMDYTPQIITYQDSNNEETELAVKGSFDRYAYLAIAAGEAGKSNAIKIVVDNGGGEDQALTYDITLDNSTFEIGKCYTLAMTEMKETRPYFKRTRSIAIDDLTEWPGASNYIKVVDGKWVGLGADNGSWKLNAQVLRHNSLSLKNGETLRVRFQGDMTTFVKDIKVGIGIYMEGMRFTLHAIDLDVAFQEHSTNQLIGEYPGDGASDEICEIFIENVKSKSEYRWGIIYGGKFFKGYCESIQQYSGFGLTISKYFPTSFKVLGVDVGSVDESFYDAALEVVDLPYDKFNPGAAYEKEDNSKTTSIKYVPAPQLTGKVTQAELAALADYHINYDVIDVNWNNSMFSRWHKPYEIAWIYSKTHNRDLLNKLIAQWQHIYSIRDDKLGVYPVKIAEGQTMQTPSWSHFSHMCYVNGEASRRSHGISNTGIGINFAAGAALAIAGNPDIWDVKYSGNTTYKELAVTLLSQAMESWNWVVKYYHDPATNLLLSPSWCEEPEGYVPQWNRVFPLLSAMNIAIDAYEKLGISNSDIVLADKIMRAMINRFWEKDNARIKASVQNPSVQAVDYPYGLYRLLEDPNQSEDLSHYGFDSKGFKIFDWSGRYWKKEWSQLLANTLCYNLTVDTNGTFCERLVGDQSRLQKNYSYWSALPHMLWSMGYNEELETKFYPYLLTVMAQNTGAYNDSIVSFTTMHIRAEKYGVEEMAK